MSKPYRPKEAKAKEPCACEAADAARRGFLVIDDKYLANKFKGSVAHVINWSETVERETMPLWSVGSRNQITFLRGTGRRMLEVKFLVEEPPVEKANNYYDHKRINPPTYNDVPIDRPRISGALPYQRNLSRAYNNGAGAGNPINLGINYFS